MEVKTLIGFEGIDSLDIDTVKSIYTNHINPRKSRLLSVFKAGNVIIDKAEGAYIYERCGNKILDMTGGYGVLNHGHNHPRIIDARKYCLDNKKLEVNKNFFSQGMAALCNNLSIALPKKLSKYFFPNSGSESVDMAMRMCLINSTDTTNKNVFLTSNRAFHGKSLGPQALGKSGELEAKFAVGIKVEYFDICDLDSLDKFKDRKDICGIFVEPFSASTMTEVSQEFLEKLSNLAKEIKALLVFDEIYSGWCKTGPLFNFMRTGVVPDILCFAKSLGGGKASIAGVAYTDNVSRVFENDNLCNYLSSTYYGFFEETVTAAEAIKVVIEENFSERAACYESEMLLINRHLKSGIRLQGKGGLWGIFFDEKNLSIIGENLSGQIKSILGVNPPPFKKVFAAALVSYIYKNYNILTGISFGFNTHIILSFNFSCREEEIVKVKDMLIDLDKKSGVAAITGFVLDYLRTMVK